MKRIKYLLILIVSIFIFMGNVLADSSQFEATINMEPEITENQINLVLGFRGEEIMAISQTLTYDATKITLLDVVSVDNFDVTVSAEEVDGKWHTVNILADSEYSFKDTDYAILVFEVKQNFKSGKNSDLFFYDVQAVGPEKSKYRYSGDYVTLTRTKNTEMYLNNEQITKSTRITYFLKEYILLIIIGILVVVSAVIAIIMLIPSRRKIENRTEMVSDSLKKENYNPNNSDAKPITLNQLEIEKIGAEEKVIDLSDAIVVSDVKPFGDIGGKDDIPAPTEENNPAGTHSIESVMGTTASTPLDPFNTKLGDESTEGTNEVVSQAQTNDAVGLINPIPSVTPAPIPSPSEPVQNTNELRAPILTVNIENSDDVEDLSLEDDDDNNNQTTGGNTNIMGMILLLVFVIGSLFTIPVMALDEDDDEYSDYRVNDLRNCIVGNIPEDSELDYSGDGVIDIVDLMYTRNTIDVNFEKLISADPGFKEIHGESPNYRGQSKKTTKVIVNKKSTTIKTVKKTTARKTTAKKTTTKKGTTTKKTTTKKSTTSKTTTSKKTTTKKSTTSKTTTSKTTTTRKSTTAKTTTTKATYIVSLVATNGSITSERSVSVVSGGSASFITAPNPGYKYGSVDCGGVAKGTYNTKGTKLTVTGVKGNATCQISYVPRTDIKVTLVVNTAGTISKQTATVGLGQSASFNVNVKTGYYIDYSSINCNGLSYSLNGTNLTVYNIQDNSSCNVTSKIKTYYMVVYDQYGHSLYEKSDIPYNYTHKGEFYAPNGAKLYCTYTSTNETKQISLGKKSNGVDYTYTYSISVKDHMTCRITV